MSAFIKSKNRKNVYKIIYENEGISKQEVSSVLNLSLPTVQQNLQYLHNNGLIYEDGEFKSTGGRRAKIIRCCYNAKVAIGVDITRNHLTVVIIDLNGKMMLRERVRLKYEDKKEYYNSIAEIINNEIIKINMPKEKILGVGFSLPVIVSSDNKTIDYASVIKLTGDFYRKISAVLDYKCLLFNDANCAGQAEIWRAKNLDDIIYLSLSSSVGGAIISENQLYPGDKLRAGEFGHIIIEPKGRECYCGNKGCADAYIRSGLLSDLEDGNIEKFFYKIEEGNEEYAEIFEQYLYYLSLVVNNLRMTFDKCVIIGGYIGRYLEPYSERLEEMSASVNPFDKSKGFIRVTSFSYEASAYGAAINFIDEFLQKI